MKKIKDILLWVYWYPIRLFVQKIPPRYVYSVGRLSGLVLYYILPGKRDALRKVFSDVFSGRIEDRESSKILLDSFEILCQNEIEVLFFSKLNRNNIRDFVECSGLENLDKALSGGQGAMLVFAHFGANQMIMPAVGYRGYMMSQMSTPATVWEEKLPNRKFSSMEKRAMRLRWQQEISLPVTHINIFGSMKEVFTCLKRNEILGIAIDGGGGKKRVAVDFLGKRALFSTGAMDIALRTKCAVLPTFMIRCNNGRNKMVIEAPMDIVYADAEDPIKKNTQVFVKKLEEYVLMYPCHYLNFLSLRTFMEGIDGIPFIIKKEGTDVENITH